MKLITSCCLLSLTITCGGVSGAEKKEVIPTENRFAQELREHVTGQLSFSELKSSIQVQAKPKARLPMEFDGTKGMNTSDGILSLGDRFAWPGCGYDRTSYTIKEITPAFVAIAYTRGIPQQDGYQDTGEFRVSYGNQHDAEQVDAGDADEAVR